MTARSSSPGLPPPLDLWTILPVLVCGVCVGFVAAGGVNEGWFQAGNAAAAAWLPPAAWAGITNLGSTLGAFSLLMPTLARWPRWMAAALLAAPFATLYTHSLKWFFDTPRPPSVFGTEAIHVIGDPLYSGSFPSGHSLTVFTVAGVVVLCSRHPLAWLVVPCAALVAFSRIAVGAHWPLDLLGGAAGGWLSAAIGCALSMRWRFWAHARGQRTLAALAFVAALAFCFENTGYPEGVWMQYLLCALGAGGALYALWRPAACRGQGRAAATAS